jgi:hypothetical protein
MNDIAEQVITGIILMVLGSVGTGIVWIVRTVLKLQSDLNAAHQKLRKLSKD